jgi:hypothetical protein
MKYSHGKVFNWKSIGHLTHAGKVKLWNYVVVAAQHPLDYSRCINIKRLRRQFVTLLKILNPWCVPHLNIPFAATSFSDHNDQSEKEIKCDCFLMHATLRALAIFWVRKKSEDFFFIETRNYLQHVNMIDSFLRTQHNFFIHIYTQFQEVTAHDFFFSYISSICFNFSLIPFRYDRVHFSTFYARTCV